MSERDHQTLRIIMTLTALLVAVGLFAACSKPAWADDDLPGGITCAEVVHYASEFKIPNTTFGRVRAKIIAAALGLRVTSAQLEAAARCLASPRSK